MTAYTTIPDSDVDPESPGTTTLFTRLRDNPIAITEGSSGAPQIQTAALSNDCVTSSKLRSPTAGSNTIFRLHGTTILQTTNTAYDTHKDSLIRTESTIGCAVVVPGVITVTFNHATSNALATSNARVVKNGTSVQSWSTTSTSSASRSVDVSVGIGDIITVQHFTSNATYYSAISNIEIKSGTSNFACV